MNRKIIQDIIVKRESKKSPKKEAGRFSIKEETSRFLEEKSKFKKESRLKNFLFGWFGLMKKLLKAKFIFVFLGLVLLIIVGIKVINAFAYVLVEITPHQEKANIDIVLKASKSGEILPLEVMELEVIKSKKAVATGQKNIETKASGRIVVYNAYSSKPVKLRATTRFETPDGKIYQIPKSIVVPGAKIEHGKIVPSSVETTVYAEKPGEEYNIGLTDFKIPGFKGTARYEKFYARSKTKMSGGFKGKISYITKEDYENVKSELEKSIEKELIKRASLQKPQGFLRLKEADSLKYIDESQYKIGDKANIFEIKEKGIFSVFLIPKKNLSLFLVQKYLGKEFQDKVEILDFGNLKFELLNKSEDKSSLTFRIFGKAKFIWKINENRLKQSLIASSRKIEKVFKSFPSIDKISITFKPSWWKKFPKNPSKISIKQIIK